MVSCGSRDLAAWWMGALKAAYPQDHYSDSGDNLKMHPAMGVTLKLNRNDGTLKIKGKKHMDWFKDNFEQVIWTESVLCCHKITQSPINYGCLMVFVTNFKQHFFQQLSLFRR